MEDTQPLISKRHFLWELTKKLELTFFLIMPLSPTRTSMRKSSISVQLILSGHLDLSLANVQLNDHRKWSCAYILIDLPILNLENSNLWDSNLWNSNLENSNLGNSNLRNSKLFKLFELYQLSHSSPEVKRSEQGTEV